MTLRRARTHSASTSSSWRHTLAVAVLALLVSVAPCAAEICNTTCALAHAQPTATDAAPASAATASSHCAKHTAATRRAIASAHACQTHADPLQPSAFGTTVAADTRLSASAHAILPIVAGASIIHPPVSSPRVERLSARLLRTRPLTVSLRI
jgi:hypothetical protein